MDTGKEFKRILRMKAVSPDYKDQQVLTMACDQPWHITVGLQITGEKRFYNPGVPNLPD